VAGVAYYDLDGDGSRGPAEPPVTGVDVFVDGRRVTTDDEGRFHSWEAMPYEGVTVALDSLSIDPEWAAVEREVLIRPSPNLFSDVTIGVHRTRELSGSVVTGVDARPVGGTRVEVVDADGNVVAEERTFSDGVFYIPRMRPGRYQIRVPAIGAQDGPPAAETTLEIPAFGEGEIVLPPLVLGRR
jgi:hypothetical protein